ncbi:MAG: type II secretion system F family protein [Bacillota bacterium]
MADTSLILIAISTAFTIYLVTRLTMLALAARTWQTRVGHRPPLLRKAGYWLRKKLEGGPFPGELRAQFLPLIGGVSLGLGFLGLTFLGPIGLLLLPVPALLVAAASQWRKNRRLSQVEGQLEQACLTLASSLRAGLSLVQGLERCASELPSPLGEDFHRAVQEYLSGVPLRIVLSNLGSRHQSLRFAYFRSCLDIYQQTGGDFIEVLAQAARTIRHARLLKEEVRARTAESQLAAMVLAAIPPLVLAFCWVAAPDLLEPLWATRVGQGALAYAGISWAAGLAYTRRIVRLPRWGE